MINVYDLDFDFKTRYVVFTYNTNMTRSQKKHNHSPHGTNNVNPRKRVENSWILLAKESLLENSDFTIVTLRHPAQNKQKKFCLDATHKKIYEVVTFSESYRSWFTDQAVKSDGSVLMLTPINPIFLVLPYIRKQCNNRAVPLRDLTLDKGFHEVLDFVTDLDNVADLKGPHDLKAYKYNESKTLAWLEKKIIKLSIKLREKNIHVASGAVSATFVASSISTDNVDEEFFRKYALGIMAEYVEEDIVEILEKKFDFKHDMIECLGKKRKSEVSESNNKRIKSERNEVETNANAPVALEGLNNVMKPKPLSAKEKARHKAASGTKTISAFFTKK